MIRAAAEGTTDTWACLFWILSWTVTLSPFQSAVFLAMSSPIFFGDRPRGPTLGAREEVAPTSPPTALRYTYLTSLGSNLGGIFYWLLVLVGIRTEVVDEGMIIPLPRSCTSEINHPKHVNEKCSTRSMEVKLLPESFQEIMIKTDQQIGGQTGSWGVISLPIIKEK